METFEILKFEMHAAIEIYSPSLQSLSDSSLRCGRVVQSIIQTGHCLTVVSIKLLDTQSNSFRPLFNTNLNNSVIYRACIYYLAWYLTALDFLRFISI